MFFFQLAAKSRFEFARQSLPELPLTQNRAKMFEHLMSSEERASTCFPEFPPPPRAAPTPPCSTRRRRAPWANPQERSPIHALSRRHSVGAVGRHIWAPCADEARRRAAPGGDNLDGHRHLPPAGGAGCGTRWRHSVRSTMVTWARRHTEHESNTAAGTGRHLGRKLHSPASICRSSVRASGISTGHGAQASCLQETLVFLCARARRAAHGTHTHTHRKRRDPPACAARSPGHGREGSVQRVTENKTRPFVKNTTKQQPPPEGRKTARQV